MLAPIDGHPLHQIADTSRHAMAGDRSVFDGDELPGLMDGAP